MKLYKIKAFASILSAGFICLAVPSKAQATGSIKGSEPAPTPVVTKGYYSIYKNAEKLKHAQSQKASAKKMQIQVWLRQKKGIIL